MMNCARINQTTSISFQSPTPVSDLLKQSGISFPFPCDSKGTCGKCKVRITGEVSPLTKKEQEFLTREEINNGYRLACQTVASGDCSIITENNTLSITSEYFLEKAPAFLDRTDGLVIDIGTTTVVAVLYQNGIPVKTVTEPNRQVIYGTDVISRIQREEDIPGVLSRLLREQIAQIIFNCGSPKQVVLVANTVMFHFLTEKEVLPLGKAPYKVASLFGETYHIFGSDCYLAPCVSAFVGADITAGILASAMTEKNETAMLVDLGTNGEIVYYDTNCFHTASTASGPAFEGMGIFMGMLAESGAINHLTYQNGKISYTTIDEERPKGICGSGLIDVLAVMLQCGAMDESGNLDPNHPYCKRDHHGKYCFEIPDTNIIIRGKDIRKLQLAKSAIHAGMLTLANRVDTLYISGGFGSYLDIENAVFIGLFPKNFSHKVKLLGNSSLAGGKLLLFSDQKREEIEKIQARCQTVDLSTNPIFTENYIEKMSF